MKEKTLQYKIAERLKRWFNVLTEVKTACGTGRIDIVAICKKTGARFGIELKRDEKKRGHDIGILIKQAARYAKSDFVIDDYHGRIPVFVYPALSYDYIICPEEKVLIGGVEYFKDRHQKDHIHHTMQGIIGVWNIGELRVFPYQDANYIRFVFNNKQIWTNQPEYNSTAISGLHEVNYNDLIIRINDNDI